MISWGTVNVGGVAFRESWAMQESGERQITIEGSPLPTDTAATTRAMHRNVLGLSGLLVPVTFSDKEQLTGFYRVASSSSNLFQQPGVSDAFTAAWSLTLERLGSERDVEFQSQVPTVARLSEVAGSASFWHAPPVGFDDYFTGATVPSASVTRTGSEGAVTVFRGVPVGVAPRWTVGAADYLRGSARVALDGVRHAGTDTPPHAGWSVSNSLLDVRSTAGAAVEVSVVAADGGPRRSVKGWVPTVGGAALSAPPEFTVLRNDPEEVVVRLSYPASPGRLTVDLSLRRGARFVTGVVKRHSAATLGVARTAAETAVAATGGLRASAADGDGNRFVVGSTRTVTTATATASISKAATVRLDFFIGHEVGASPVAGDGFADLFGQFLGCQSERTKAMRR